jgi:hypothetical protein
VHILLLSISMESIHIQHLISALALKHSFWLTKKQFLTKLDGFWPKTENVHRGTVAMCGVQVAVSLCRDCFPFSTHATVSADLFWTCVPLW